MAGWFVMEAPKRHHGKPAAKAAFPVMNTVSRHPSHYSRHPRGMQVVFSVYYGVVVVAPQFEHTQSDGFVAWGHQVCERQAGRGVLPPPPHELN